MNILSPLSYQLEYTIIALSLDFNSVVSVKVTKDGYGINLKMDGKETPKTIEVKQGDNKWGQIQLQPKLGLIKTDPISPTTISIPLECGSEQKLIDIEKTGAFTNFISNATFKKQSRGFKTKTVVSILQKLRQSTIQEDEPLKKSLDLIKDDIKDFSISKDSRFIALLTVTRIIKIYKLADDGLQPSLIKSFSDMNQASFVKLSTFKIGDNSYGTIIYSIGQGSNTSIKYVRTIGDSTKVYTIDASNVEVHTNIQIQIIENLPVSSSNQNRESEIFALASFSSSFRSKLRLVLYSILEENLVAWAAHDTENISFDDTVNSF